MRRSGNSHEVSWNASYEVIKRQTNNLFKTSPKHSAVMIVEAVVENPEGFEKCGKYIGDLFSNSQSQENIINTPENTTKEDRYSY